MSIRFFAIALAVTVGCTDSSDSASQTASIMTYAELAALEQPVPDHKISYGEDPRQFGHLTVPDGAGPHPVIVLIHGGCWLAQYDLEHIGLMSSALVSQGVAVWSIEYRRVGHAGGGWPGTFRDVATGADFIRELSDDHPIDPNRVYAMGHSAGGQLALWLASRAHLPEDAELYQPNPLPIRGVIGLAAVPQLEAAHAAGVCGQVVDKLMGGSPEAMKDRYAQVAPHHLLPLGIRQVLINGAHDTAWYRYGQEYYEQAKAAGDDVEFVVSPDAGHFELVTPTTSTWPIVRDAVRSMVDAEDD